MSDEREALARDLAAVMHEEYYKGGTSISRMASAAVAAGWRRSPAPAQPADAAVIERARWYLGLTDDEARQHDTIAIADELAYGCLAEHARAEAAVAECGWLRRTAIAELVKQCDTAEQERDALERSRDGYERLLVEMQGRATAAEAALAEVVDVPVLKAGIAAALRRAHDAGLERAAQLIDEMADSEDDLRATASAHNDRRWAETHANQAALLRHAAAPAIRALKEAPHG